MIQKWLKFSHYVHINKTICRFPLPTMCLFILAYFNIVNAHTDLPNPISMKILLLIISSLFSFIAIQLFTERKPKFFFRGISLSAIALAGQLIIFFKMHDIIFMNSFLFFIPGLIVAIIIAAPLCQKTRNIDFCYYLWALIRTAVFSGFITVILCGGISLTLCSIQSLFSLSIQPYVFLDILIVGASVFAPLLALSGIPKIVGGPTYPKRIEFLLTYILSPFVLIYMLILYAYGAKILIQLDLPKGNVANIVACFGILGILTHLFSFPLLEKKNKLVLFIHRYFYPSLFLPIILLVVAIGRRIEEYGLTESRYAISLIAIWFLLSAIYTITFKIKHLKVIPIILCVLLVLGSFGPWSAPSLSTQSQLSILKNTLKENHILEGGKIVPATQKLPFETEQKINSTLDHLDSKKQLSLITKWFPEDTINPNDHGDKKTLLEKMGIHHIKAGT